MAKIALLIGVSEYQSDLNPLPATIQDIEAMRRILQNPDMGGFAEENVKLLKNPDRQQMEENIEELFAQRHRDDLVLLFFSGHGITDDDGRLYFATQTTRIAQGELKRSSAVSASFIHESMTRSRSKRQVVILDSCFSGAFVKGLSPKNAVTVDIRKQLGGEGRAVLASSSSTQYSFGEKDGNKPSIYTRYLVEGIETGAADLDSDGLISVDELHEYASRKVRDATPLMKPEVHVAREGYKIWLAQAPTNDPKLKYRREVERFTTHGIISNVGQRALEVMRQKLNLPLQDARNVEAEVLTPYEERRKKLQKYEQAYRDEVQQNYPLRDDTANELKRFRELLGLRQEDVAAIEQNIISTVQEIEEIQDTSVVSTPTDSGAAVSTASLPKSTQVANFSPRQTRPRALLVLALMAIALVSGNVWLLNRSANETSSSPDSNTISVPEALDDRISRGEQSLIVDESGGNQSFELLKQQGIAEIKAEQYEQAVQSLQIALQHHKNAPETLIYFNNAQIGLAESYTLAVAAPIGSNKNEGLEVLRGIAQAQNEVNQAGGIRGIRLKIAIVNDDDDDDIAQQLAVELANDSDVLGVIGHFSSRVTLKAREVYNAQKLPCVTAVSTSVELTRHNVANDDFFGFRIVPSDAIAGRRLADYMIRTVKETRAAVFFEGEEPYSESIKQRFAHEVAINGGEIVEEFDFGSPNFNAVESVREAIASGARVLMLAPPSKEESKVLATQVFQAAYDRELHLLGGDVVYSSNLLQEIGELMVGTVVAVPWDIDSLENQSKPFTQQSNELWGGEINWITAFSYDATQVFIEAIKRVDQDNGDITRLALQEAISDQNFATVGASGSIQFSNAGERINPKFELVEVRSSSSETGYDFVPIF